MAEFGKRFGYFKRKKFLNNAGLVIRFLRHCQLLGEIYTQDIQKLNYVQKEVNDILSVIIILETYVHDGETFFKWNDYGLY